MENATITVKTEAGKALDVVVASMSSDAIWVVLGTGLNSVKCKLVPTNNGLAYAGSVMGREIVYERSVKQVKADIDRQHQLQANYRPRR